MVDSAFIVAMLGPFGRLLGAILGAPGGVPGGPGRVPGGASGGLGGSWASYLKPDEENVT